MSVGVISRVGIRNSFRGKFQHFGGVEAIPFRRRHNPTTLASIDQNEAIKLPFKNYEAQHTHPSLQINSTVRLHDTCCYIRQLWEPSGLTETVVVVVVGSLMTREGVYIFNEF